MKPQTVFRLRRDALALLADAAAALRAMRLEKANDSLEAAESILNELRKAQDAD